MAELYNNILEAHRAIRPQVAVTPLQQSTSLSAAFGCNVLLKHETMQPTGSFKIRGATNKIRRLVQQGGVTRVLAASTGNHGLAVARAGALAGVPITVYVGSSTIPSKMAGIRALGAELVVIDGPPIEAELAARRRAEAEGQIGRAHV